MNLVYIDYEEQRFKRILRASLAFYLSAGILIAIIQVAPPSREISDVPRKIARLIVKPAPPKPVPVPVAPKVKTEPAEKSSTAPAAKEVSPLEKIQKNREIAKKSGVLAALAKEEDLGRLNRVLDDDRMSRSLSNAELLRVPVETAKKGSVRPKTITRMSSDAKSRLAGPASLGESDRTRLREDKKHVVSLPKTVESGGGSSGTGLGLGDGTRVRVIGNGSGLGGLIDYDAIARVVEKYKKGILYLYNKELRTFPTLKGTITVEFSIDANGDVVAVQLVSTSMDHPVLEEALTGRIKQWKFPRLYDGVIVVTYPFVFFPV